MEKKAKTAPQIAQIATKICALLDPLSSEDRRKAINGSLTMLGEASGGAAADRNGASGLRTPAADGAGSHQDMSGVHARAITWMKQNGLNQEQVEQVFDTTSDGIRVIISEVPGKGRKEQTHNAYVLLGISRFLATGDATFEDAAARQLCTDLGCLDLPNHSKFMGDKGNVLTGSKKAGWKLTAPGLKHGVGLIKQVGGKEA